MTDSPNQRLCKDCKEWIDARAPSCYLCGGGETERNAALVNAVQTERLNGHLMGEATRARQEQAVARQIASTRGSTGPDRLYNIDGARSLASHYKSELRQAGFGE